MKPLSCKWTSGLQRKYWMKVKTVQKSLFFDTPAWKSLANHSQWVLSAKEHTASANGLQLTIKSQKMGKLNFIRPNEKSFSFWRNISHYHITLHSLHGHSPDDLRLFLVFVPNLTLDVFRIASHRPFRRMVGFNFRVGGKDKLLKSIIPWIIQLNWWGLKVISSN